MGWHNRLARYAGMVSERVARNCRQQLFHGKLNLLLNTWKVDIVGSSLASSVIGFHALSSLGSPTKASIAVQLGCIAAVGVTLCKMERIPFTKRLHFVMRSTETDIQLAECLFAELNDKKILPATHPDSLRVRLILKGLIEGLKWSLRNEHVCSDLSYCKYLESLDWEVAVIDNPKVMNAHSYGGGKISIQTGMFKLVKSDAEVAAIIAHEVAHNVARHPAEWSAIRGCLNILRLQLILSQFIMPNVFGTSAADLMRLSLSRRNEFEADYTSMMLVASAGYDPHIVPTVWEKMLKIHGKVIGREYYSTHPCDEKRARVLAEAQVMQEAMKLYRKRVPLKGSSR